MSYSSEVLADSPWGAWLQAESSGTTLADYSGNSRALTISGTAATLHQPGPGTGLYAVSWAGGTVGSAETSGGITTSAVTVEMWVYMTAYPSAQLGVGCALSNGSSTADKDLFIDSSGRPVFYVFDGSIATLTGTALSLNTWHHVVGSVGPGGFKLRVDKVTVASGATSASYAGVAQKFFVRGGASGAGGGAINLTGLPAGTIALPAIYPTQLSDARTDAHYNAATAPATVNLSTVKATATAAAVAPTWSKTGLLAVAATATALALAPALSTGNAPVSLTTATATATASAPAPTLGRSPLAAVPATATAQANPAALSFGAATYLIPASTATGDAHPTGLNIEGSPLALAAVRATATAQAHPVVRSSVIDGWTYDDSGLDLVDIDDETVVLDSRPPIAPLPPYNLVRPIMRRSHLVDPADFIRDPQTGFPRSAGTHEVVEEVVGYEHVFINGRDVTYWGGVPVKVDRLTESNLFADDTGSITFPTISSFDETGTGDLSWLTPEAPVDVAIVGLDGVRLEPDIWNGHLVSENLETGRDNVQTWDMVGALTQARDQMHQVPVIMPPTDVGAILAKEFNGVENRSYAALPNTVTGIKLRLKGSIDDKRMDYALAVLAQAWSDDGRQWAISKVGARRFQLGLRDTTTVHWTATTGTPGIQISLSRDQTQRVDRVFARGISPVSGLPWCNNVFPDVLPYDPPDYPFADASNVIELGTTDASTTSGTGVTTARNRLRERGFHPASSGPFNSTDRSATLAFQRAAGIQDDGEIGPQTWNALWLSSLSSSDASAFRRPMAWRPDCEQWLFGVNGAKTGRNPLWDGTVRTKDIPVDFGVCSKADGFRLARIRLARDAEPGWVGRVTFKLDPQEGSKEFIRAGQNLLVKAWRGEDVLVHITQVDRDRTAGTVTCTVDSKFRDALTVEQIIQRNRESLPDPARRPGRVDEATSIQQNRLNPFEDDSPAGQVPRIAINGDSGLWSVWRVYISEAGQIDRIRLATSGPATTFSFGLFGTNITPNQLAMYVGNPLTNPDAWTANKAILKDRFGYINSAGNSSEACGTWPYDDGTTVTGEFQDDQAGVVFKSQRGGNVWLAMFAATSCYIEGAIIPKANQ